MLAKSARTIVVWIFGLLASVCQDRWNKQSWRQEQWQVYAIAAVKRGIQVLQSTPQALADRFRVYLPFHPGFGESGPAPHVRGMQDMIIHYLHLLPALEVDLPHLVGHSMGGWMAAEIAAVAGEHFNRLVLNAPVGLNHPDYPMANLGEIPLQEFPGYLAHNVDVALKYFPGGAEAPSPEEFGAARQREDEALGNILKTHGFGHPNLGRWLSRIPNAH